MIDTPVDPCLELAEIQRRVVAQQGPALLFTRVKGTKFPVATNLFGARRRIDLAFGEDPYRFFKRVVEAIETTAMPSVSQLWKFRDLAKTGLKLGTAKCRSVPTNWSIGVRGFRPATLTVFANGRGRSKGVWRHDGMIRCWFRRRVRGRGRPHDSRSGDRRYFSGHFKITRLRHEAQCQNQRTRVNKV